MFLIVMLLIILVAFFMQRKTENSLMIKNLTSNDITVTKVVIDELEVLNSKIKIPPELIEKQSKVHARLEIAHPKIAHLTIDTIAEVSKEMECKLPNDENLRGCLFITHVTNHGLNCVCDSYSDFNN